MAQKICSIFSVLNSCSTVLPHCRFIFFIGWLGERPTPLPLLDVAARLKEAKAKIRQALVDIERPDRGEDLGYWGDSDIDRLDMALALVNIGAPAMEPLLAALKDENGMRMVYNLEASARRIVHALE